MIIRSDFKMIPEDNFHYSQSHIPEEILLWCLCVSKQLTIWFSGIDNKFFARNKDIYYEFERDSLTRFLSNKGIDCENVNAYMAFVDGKKRYMFDPKINPQTIVNEFIERHCNKVELIK